MPLILPLLEQKQKDVYSLLQKRLSIYFKSFKINLDTSDAAPLLWHLDVKRQQQELTEIEKVSEDLLYALLEESVLDG